MCESGKTDTQTPESAFAGADLLTVLDLGRQFTQNTIGWIKGVEGVSGLAVDGLVPLGESAGGLSVSRRSGRGA